MYLKLARERKNWITIDCVDNEGNIFSKEDIHKKIIAALKEKNIV
jgi:hypothetical protein